MLSTPSVTMKEIVTNPCLPFREIFLPRHEALNVIGPLIDRVNINGLCVRRDGGHDANG